MSVVKDDSVLEKETIVSSSNEKDELAAEAAKRRSRMPIYVISACVIISLIAGFGWWLYARQFATTDDAFIEGNITYVTPKISAHVVKLHVEENQFVKKGDLLIEFEAAEAAAKLAQAQAVLQTALANYEKTQADAALTRVTSRARLNQASSNLEKVKNSVEESRIQSSGRISAVEQARSQVNTAEINIKQVKAQIPGAQAGLEQARAQVSAARSKIDVARIEYERDQDLFKAGVVSKQKLDLSAREQSVAQAEMTTVEKQVEVMQSRLDALLGQVEVEVARLNEARNRVTAAENDHRLSLNQVDSAALQVGESAGRLQEAKTLPEQVAIDKSQVSASDAEVARARASLAQAELELSYSKIYSPQDGFISRKAVQEGQLVQPDQTLMAVTQGKIWVIANFKETQIENMHAGQPVDIYVDAYPGVAFHGKVESFQAGTGSRFSVLPAENATGNFVKVVQRIPVKIVFDETPDNKKYLLVPGMSAVPKVRIR